METLLEKQHFVPIVLFNGYSRTENDKYFANCSCVLVKGPPNIIIDTMSSWDSEQLVEALKNHSVSPNEINYVINTHSHPDHIGCNFLFPDAIHIVGFSICHKNQYFDHDFKSGKEYIINDSIKIIPTPGHTLQDVTVLIKVKNETIAVTGDLFEKEEDLTDETIWIQAGSDDENLQRSNRNYILQIADYIVPGHGPMFKVQK